MINLIPQKAKKSILIEYWVRVITVWLTLWSIALFAGAAIVLPTYVLITSQVSFYETSAAEASQKVANFDSSSQALVQASQQARVIMDAAAAPVFSDYIKLFESLQGPGIQMSQIDLSLNKEGIEPVILEGSATNRQTLAAFRDRLKADDRVESALLPIDNLANETDNKFTITVTLANNDEI